MVSRKQLVLIIRRGLWASALASLGMLRPVSAGDDVKKFYADDPLWRDPAPRSVKAVAVRKVDDIYDFVENSYVTPGREGKAAKREPRRAGDTNTLGEVPDSAWYTNRHAGRRMTIAELERGPGNATPPSSTDSWRIVGAKSDGVTPGFVIEDRNKNRYLLKLDPPGHPELCSAADVIGSKFLYALGYHTPENYVVRFRRENLAIGDGVMWRDSNGKKHPLTARALDEMFRGQAKRPDGSFRALASRWLGGQVVGPFSYRGTRSDDPNDTVDHENRRVLRGLAVFASWLNHHDTRSINTMDALVVEDGRQFVKHYLMDFGSTLGSAGYGPKEAWIGHEYTIAHRETAKQLLTLGFLPPRWTRAEYPKLTGVGLFDAWSFDPMAWKSNYPNPAFLMMDTEDAFWAAKQVAAFTDAEIRAIVQTGQYSDQRAANWIADCLIQRRDKIAEAWFSRVLPVDGFRIADGRLAFDDLMAIGGFGAARNYSVQWSTFDNERNRLTALPNTAGAGIPTADGGVEFLAATISCREGISCPKPVVVYLRRGGGGFTVVGVDR
jgi:hypothetical protein